MNYDGMVVFAVVGVCVNFAAAYVTHGGHSLNQKAVNLHMLEDVLGWAVVLVGAIVMRFTDFALLDPLGRGTGGRSGYAPDGLVVFGPCIIDWGCGVYFCKWGKKPEGSGRFIFGENPLWNRCAGTERTPL